MRHRETCRYGLSVMALAALASLSAAAVTVEVEGPCVGMGEVSWSQGEAAEGMVSLSLEATASAGNAFSGWIVDGESPEWDLDARNPSISGVEVATNAVVEATFVEVALDTLYFDLSLDFEELVCGEPVNVPLSIDSMSYPKLSFSGLPPGLAYNPRTQSVSGVPTTPCFAMVVVSGRNASGYTFSQTLHVSVADISGKRLQSTEESIAVGEYYHSEFGDLFSCDDERVFTSLTGIPPGLTWNPSWDLLYGTPTKAGVYILTATAEFPDGSSETATSRLFVNAPDPGVYGVNVEELDGLAVGDVLEPGDLELGTYEGGEGVTYVKGLPGGLEVRTWAEEDGAVHYEVVGIVRSAGLFAVNVGVACDDGTVVDTELEVIVFDAPDRYVRASVSPLSPAGSGSVTGGGVIPVVSGAKLSAKAAGGYVFAGWRDAYGEIADVGDGVDYRSPSLSYGPEADFEFLELYALFVPVGQDAELSIASLDEIEFEFSADGFLDEEFDVESASLPTLVAKGLPAGVSIVPGFGPAYRVVYDAETSASHPSPGRYVVTATAKNVSGAADSARFIVTVSNIIDPRIAIDDDYGEYVPDEEIDPIDLSSAVDLSKGESLTVSGLPNGLVYNKSANAKKGIEAYTITGTPKTPGYYTMKFTAKVVAAESTNASGRVTRAYETAQATAFITVLPYPLLSVSVDSDALAAGNAVSGAGNYKPGTKVTLKAKAAKGWVFAGWEGAWDVDGLALLSPTIPIVADDYDMDISATFVPLSEDSLSIDRPPPTDAGFDVELELGVDVADGEHATVIADAVKSVSYPTVKVSGLPSGVKFSASTLLLSGKPKKAGVYYATVTAKNAGGYCFTRIMRMAVLGLGGEIPEEAAAENAAGIDFSPVAGLVTGTYYSPEDAVLEIGASPASGAAPVKATVSGVPAGLVAKAMAVDDRLLLEFVGTPTKVARSAVTVKVTYADKKTLASKAFVNVEDGGSAYLFVLPLDESLGTVAGGGVYSAGATVKLSAKPKSKCVFAGWFADMGGESADVFAPLAERDGLDLRTASVSFPFRPADFASVDAIVADFAHAEDDKSLSVLPSSGGWDVDPCAASEFAFSVDSLSLPKVTAKNLPKGVVVDLARGKLVYTPDASVKSGIYYATLSAKNQSGASASADIEIRVANRVTDMVGGLDPSMDAYNLSVGVMSGEKFIVPKVDEGVKLSVSGLPSGLSFKNGVVSGLPTKAGAYTVTFTATSGGGSAKKTGVATVTVVVMAPPAPLAGTFNGFVYEWFEPSGPVIGAFTATATAAGKISATIKTHTGTERFSATGWLSFDVERGIAHSEMMLKNGSMLDFDVNSGALWSDWQLHGTFKTQAGTFAVAAQRNSFGAKDGCDEARELAARLAGKYSYEGLKLTLDKAGTAKISGKYGKRTVAGSSILSVDEDGNICVKLLVIDKDKGDMLVTVRFELETLEAHWSIDME